ncbi:hypothetical protein ACFOU2_22705 [Bacillus songklensis]|uniref:YesK-like protein n=1 Tax=Bacillus songklensis TaxID=1069116 RepID=A0ABV8B9P1_9BACI
MNEFTLAAIVCFSAMFIFTVLLYKRYKQRPSLKYIPAIFVFVLSFGGILTGIFVLKEIEGLSVSFISTAINIASLVNIVIAVFLDLFGEMNKA